MKCVQLKKDSLSDMFDVQGYTVSIHGPSILILNLGKDFSYRGETGCQRMRNPSEMELLNLQGSAQHHVVQLLQKRDRPLSPLDLL